MSVFVSRTTTVGRSLRTLRGIYVRRRIASVEHELATFGRPPWLCRQAASSMPVTLTVTDRICHGRILAVYQDLSTLDALRRLIEDEQPRRHDSQE
jgi:hypothetical protein